ncbi:unnamed protein product [Nezara viridula]|uniref:Uncharacterized protein n=1 Tax=Nezara viridula TaxID=85310 RepID=A0A9P0HSC6_NEZVI|nr:unnamed protein product [Nezara viridula]
MEIGKTTQIDGQHPLAQFSGNLLHVQLATNVGYRSCPRRQHGGAAGEFAEWPLDRKPIVRVELAGLFLTHWPREHSEFAG